MKKYKPNMMLGIACLMSEFMLPAILVIPIMIYMIDGFVNYSVDDLILGIKCLVFALPGFILFFSILNTITLPFTKHNAFIEDGIISTKHSTVKCREVTQIAYDSGEYSKYGSSSPACLDLYIESELVLSVNHPSLTLIITLLFRCRGAKFRYTQYKRFLILIAVFVALSIILPVLGKMGIEI
ncbi:MAG: hypothetical protein E7634_04290 [Ruminococcaceae bacterium]|nr:hypothetical protein [Oscillospiraceae bacterium]